MIFECNATNHLFPKDIKKILYNDFSTLKQDKF